MKREDIQKAAALLAKSRLEGRFLNELPLEARPIAFTDAVAIQTETARVLGEKIVGYKVTGVQPETVTWGAILASRLLAHPATMPAASVPLLGVEAEIAYRLNIDLEARHRLLTLNEFDEITTVIPAIEVVDTRFLSYLDAPLMDRNADFMSNGALIVADPWLSSEDTDFIKLPVTLERSGVTVVETVGGHPAVDPRLPALAFFQSADRPDRVAAGTIITTGTYTGLNYFEPGDIVSASFSGYGTLEVSFTR
ncbi:2-keto-4-pentenoate hydratase [Rhizobium sp. BK313]|uniref:fumarylacetoacetate hydrolase family protein n=1 Tax=Rhizobium sp. BK313 TaxID=2587081 RepID=UPI00105BF652|nr:fumarylacetoacetate hydrolase family protein [Rhizobium sp. BK313]MBB3458701.1 2-keto-4-pentenoate hydratase [Rhizobium sp. BK313]